MADDQNPVNPLPPVVVVLALAIFGIEAVLSLAAQGILGGQAGIGWRQQAVTDYGFSPRVWEYVIERGVTDPDLIRRFVTYLFVQISFTHALFAGALTLALGKFVGEAVHWMGLVAIFFGSAIVGAFVYGWVLEGAMPLVGAFPAVYGLIGAFTYILWMQLGAKGENRWMAFRLIGFLLALQLIFGLLFGGSPSWIADLTGFVTGLALCTVIAPGGWRALVERLRDRGLG